MYSNLNIIIPTVKFNRYLDKAIQSAIEVKIKKKVIVWVNNKSLSGFEISEYFKNENVIWKCIEKDILPMHENWNEAIKYVQDGWVFLLSDDDIIKPEFMENIDISTYEKNTLFSTSTEIIDENGDFIKNEVQSISNDMSPEDVTLHFLRDKIFHHLSLFVFHTDLFWKCGGYIFCGFPNGFYLDTVLHGKLIANCSDIIVSDRITFSRRQSNNQASNIIYYKNINDFFEIISNNLYNDKNLRLAVNKLYGNKSTLKKRLIQFRFITDWSKLNIPTFNRSNYKKLKFITYFLFKWNAGNVFKVKALMIVLLWPFKSYFKKLNFSKNNIM